MFFKKNRHPVEPLFKQHQVLNLEKQKILAIACFMRRVVKEESPSTITEQFSLKERMKY